MYTHVFASCKARMLLADRVRSGVVDMNEIGALALAARDGKQIIGKNHGA